MQSSVLGTLKEMTQMEWVCLTQGIILDNTKCASTLQTHSSVQQNHLNIRDTEEQGSCILFNLHLGPAQAGVTMDLPAPFGKGLE